MLRKAWGFALLVCLSGCDDEPVDCNKVRTGDWAIQITAEDPEDPCDLEGTFSFENGPLEPLTCDKELGECTCRGGSEFGSYRVTITDNTVGETQTAVILVEEAPPPECLVRDAEERFMPIGGAGGSADL